jgi:hypothetical protein
MQLQNIIKHTCSNDHMNWIMTISVIIFNREYCLLWCWEAKFFRNSFRSIRNRNNIPSGDCCCRNAPGIDLQDKINYFISLRKNSEMNIYNRILEQAGLTFQLNNIQLRQTKIANFSSTSTNFVKFGKLYLHFHKIFLTQINEQNPSVWW